MEGRKEGKCCNYLTNYFFSDLFFIFGHLGFLRSGHFRLLYLYGASMSKCQLLKIQGSKDAAKHLEY